MKQINFNPYEQMRIINLFQPMYLLKTVRTKGECYVMYDQQRNPHWKVNTRTIDKLQQLSLLKKDHKNRYTLNLSAVRSLHGNHFIKQYYKTTKLKPQQNEN